jgi:hypothetical protein
VYHGPKEEVVPFFESLGFKLPPRKGTADFLQEITSKKDQKVGHPCCLNIPKYTLQASEL